LILTIGMIVKNEEKHLRRCLEALLPILKQVDSELIIADTGSTDTTVDIAAEYTDKIFNFDWCDDFSAARNATLMRAHGKWFMTVDADEVFEDTSELIRFFNTNDYKNYNMATFIQRSPNTANSSNFCDLNVLRLSKRVNGLQYVNAIHESFNIVRDPIKYLPTVAYHYGYIVADKAFIDRKTKRNMDIILREVEKNPHKAANYHSLYQLYFMGGQYEAALKCCQTGLQYAKEEDGLRQFVFYINITSIYYFMKKYDDALETIDTYFSARPEPLAFDLEMYCLQGHTYFDMSDFNNAINAFEAYIKFYGEYKQGLHHGSEILLYTESSSKPLSYRDAAYKLASAYLNVNNIASVKRYIDLIAISDWLNDSAYIARRLALEMNLMHKTLDFSALPALYRQVSGSSLELLQDMIEKDIAIEQFRSPILAVFAKEDFGDAEYLKLLALRFHYFNTKDLTPAEIEQFLCAVSVWKPLYADVIYFSLNACCQISLLSQKIDPYDLKTFLFDSAFLHFDDLPQVICSLSQNISVQAVTLELSMQIWLSFLYLWALGSGKLAEADVFPLYSAYSRMSAEYLRGVFQDRIITEQNAHLIPKLLRAGYYCSESLRCANLVQCCKLIRAAVTLYPTLAGAAGIVLSALYNEQYGPKSQGEPSELEKYAAIIKSNIRRSIVSCQRAKAEETLLSYKQLCPDDAEITELEMLLD